MYSQSTLSDEEISSSLHEIENNLRTQQSKLELAQKSFISYHLKSDDIILLQDRFPFTLQTKSSLHGISYECVALHWTDVIPKELSVDELEVYLEIGEKFARFDFKSSTTPAGNKVWHGYLSRDDQKDLGVSPYCYITEKTPPHGKILDPEDFWNYGFTCILHDLKIPKEKKEIILPPHRGKYKKEKQD